MADERREDKAAQRRDQAAEFAKGAEEPDPGFFADLVDFIRTSKKWWLTPIIVVLLLVGVVIVLSTTAAGPFIYALF